MEMDVVIRQILVLLLMMAVGYAANRRRILNGESEKVLSRLILHVTSPMLILYSVTNSKYLEDTKSFVMIFVVAICYYMMVPFVAGFLLRLLRVPDGQRAFYKSMFIFSNIGFMGIPVVSSIFGTDSLLYVSVFMAIFNISIFSYGYTLLEEGSAEEHPVTDWKKMLNPGTVAAVIAIVMYIFRLRFPAILEEPIQAIGDTTTPLAMIVIGSMLAGNAFSEILRDRRMIAFTVLKMIVFPATLGLIGSFLIQDKMLLGVLVVLAAMPVATNVAMICNDCNRDTTLVAEGTFLTTISSVVTIPLTAYMMMLFCM